MQRAPSLDAGAGDASAKPSDAGTTADASAVTLDAGESQRPNLPCNGLPGYCSMRYDELCQAATLDSAANSTTLWQKPTQNQSIVVQLQRSIRVLMLELRDENGTLTVCRGDCTDGNIALSVVLDVVKTFLASNAREVVTLLIDSSLTAAAIEAEFSANALDQLTWNQTPGERWPTLQAMIDAGKRLVVFANTSDQGNGWLLSRQAYIWETGANWPLLSAMNCTPAVGDRSRPLYLVHHNLADSADGDGAGQARESLASEANDWATATARLQACKAQYNRVPNFLAVDYFNAGDPVGATQVINGQRAAP